MPKIVGRESEISSLSNILSNSINIPLILVYGSSSSGKTLIVNNVLSEKCINNIYNLIN